ncbi:magnesium transporter [Cryptococcus neoformans Tu259-1]|uniref:Magnesium transporter n=1 Tax=Cryptococcus neoformans Tu259-1 TaxID=1230072 RepID=A0A854QDD1_CRYNE|nr:magnesium transporter [Cryptococcus neoformans var. grubii Tu259-1]
MPDRTPTSPRPVVIDVNSPLINRSIPVSSPNILTPSRSTGPPSVAHRGSMSRKHRPANDADARERQTQQDIESAMSMSRARSGSMNLPDNSPPISRPSQLHFPSTSPIQESHFPMLSEAEEADMERARRLRPGRDNESDDEHGHGGHYHSHDEERGEEGRERRDSITESTGYDSRSRLIHRRGSDGDIHDMDRARQVDLRSLGGHGLKNKFNFSAMEEFATRERENLFASEGAWAIDGGNGALRRRSVPHKGAGASEENIHQPNSYDTAFERTNTMSAFGDETEPPFSPERGHGAEDHAQTFQRRRQRKLSQSNPVYRQKKLALFEGFGPSAVTDGESAPDAPSTAFKAPRQAKSGFAPYTDAAPGHDRPYRFSFYSNAMPVTIHSRSLAELPAEGQTFEDLFKGRNPSDNAISAENSSAPRTEGSDTPNKPAPPVEPSTMASAKTNPSLLSKAVGAAMSQQAGSGGQPNGGFDADEDPEQYTWWLDVLSPTDEEMRMLSKAFGIHPLTTEDILLEETREKIELFRNYYLVCFRSFDQDPYSQTYLEPLNMYIIVFREGTLSFHFRGTPHPQNVRRRIKHLKDYISVTSDWISYALIDDITDAFGPLIQGIEFEVDSIDELVLILKEAEQSDMLRRIGTCRKKVMGLLRLMGNKADVVKGLAKRCNEQWLVAPKSDIGLYLSDIQDHLITMTQNLNHYEKILSRSHSNYLAQISIEMTDANNQINDVLSKLTALGTVLIPMNLVTGLWGMNVHVPGQDIEEGYTWFGGILGCLCLFAILGAWATVSRIFLV